MRAFAVWLTKQCISFDLIEKDLFEWCVYSFEKRITSLLTWVFLLTIGFYFFGVIHTIAFVGSFLFLRKYTNGYHASTYLGCLMLSILVELFGLTFAQSLPLIPAVIMVCLSDIVIMIYAPCNDIKIHLNAAEGLALKTKIRRCVLLLNGTYIILAILQSSISNYIAVALAADAISLKVKNNKFHN